VKTTIEKENTMFETNLARLIVHDILLTGEYTLDGIAQYANSHEDVIHEIFTGQNPNPSAILLRRLLELHRMVRRELYLAISKKITEKYLSVA
jgi:hypothetical protein